MKALQKSLLSIVVTILFVDLFIQLTGHQQLATLTDLNLHTSPMTFWAYPIAFIIGSFLTSYLLYYYSHFSIISLFLFLVGLIQGSYTLISSVKSFVYLRSFHGFLVASILIVVLTWLSNLIGQENYRKRICKYIMMIPLSCLLILPLHQAFSQRVEANWTIFILMYAFIFISVLTFLLMGYLTGLNNPIVPISIRGLKEAYFAPGLIFYFSGIIIGAYTLGTLFQTITKTNIAFLKLSPLQLTICLLVGLFLAIIGKFGAVSNEIGDIKSILMSLLLLALGLCLLPLLTQSIFILIPMGICGLSLGILITSIYGGITENIRVSCRGLTYGLLQSFLLLGYLWGWVIADSIYYQQHSPYFFNSLLIIGASIIFIRKIHENASSYGVYKR